MIGLWSFLAALAFAVIAAPPAPAAPPHAVPPPATPEPSPQGTYGDWSLYSFDENGNPVCYLAARVQSSSESVPRRGVSFVLITHRPAEGKKGVVSVVAGYRYDKASAVTLAIGRKQFQMFPSGDTAWAEDPVDPQIVAAIRGGGAKITVTGRPQGGPTTTDSFSLKGAAAALQALDKTCPVAGNPSQAVVHRKKKTQ